MLKLNVKLQVLITLYGLVMLDKCYEKFAHY